MVTYSKTPAYNLKVVIQETDIKPDTLRAWERRYGIPMPSRSEGKHRLYSDYDIATIKWLLIRQEEGMSISRAVRLWRTLEEKGKNPLQELPSPPPSALHTERLPATLTPPPLNISGTTIEELRHAWVDACLHYNEPLAEQSITQAFALYPPNVACLEVLQKGLQRIGELWYQNKATVQQEHFASGLAMRRLNTLVTAAPQPNRPGRIIVGCPANEHHVFAPLYLTLILRHSGWETLYLGANVPREYLESTIAYIHPDLIVMTAQQLHTAASLCEVADLLRRERVALAYGGLVFNQMPALRQRVTGHFLGEELGTAVHAISDILATVPPIPEAKPIAREYVAARHHFRSHQAEVEAEAWHFLQKESFPYEHLTNANLHLARDIMAALTLGNVSFLGSQVAWTETLLLNYDMPVHLLKRYLQAYSQAAHNILDQTGAPILEWLATIAAEQQITDNK